MKVFCDSNTCAFEKNGYCTQKQILIENGECQDYQHYQDVYSEEYCHKFYKAVKTKNGVRAKALFESGKKIEYQGLTFYTEDKVNEDDDYWLTEETTGAGGSFAHVKARFELCIKAIKKSPKINELPLAVENENGEWEIAESEENK